MEEFQIQAGLLFKYKQKSLNLSIKIFLCILAFLLMLIIADDIFFHLLLFAGSSAIITEQNPLRFSGKY